MVVYVSPEIENGGIFDVKSFYAKGDNLTNDGPAIQAALDAAWKAGGGHVIVPRGIYRVMSSATSSSPLKIRSNVRLTLLPGAEIHRYHNAGGASLVWSADWTQNMAGFNGHRNIIIEGGIWDMRNSASSVSLASDAFPRANTSAPHTLGVADSGQTWIDETSRDDGTSTSGNLGIVSNTAFNPAASTAISTIKVWPDGTTSCTVPTTGTTGYAGLVFRLENAQSYWQYVRDNANSGNARLSYWVNGVETVVTPNTTRAVAAGETLTVTRFGSAIRAYVVSAGGVYTLTHDTTDAAGFTNARRAGLIITDTTSRLDNFSSSASIWADNFTRANSTTSLGTTSSGYPWSAGSGVLGINTNKAYAPGNGTNISVVNVTSETNPTVTVSTTGTNAAGLVFRYIDSSNYWYYVRNAAGNAEMGKVVAGVTTVITPTATQAVAAGNVLQVKVIGYEIQGYVGTTLTHDVANDSTNYVGTAAGIMINDTTSRLSAFDTPAAWGVSSGACFSFSHTTNVTFRDLTVRDTHQNSHSIDMHGMRDTLVDNCRFLGCVGNSSRGAIQIDASVNDGNPPIDSTSCENLLIRGCTVSLSYNPGTNAYPRAFESHAGKVGAWYKNIRIVDNYMEVVEKGIKGYNWNNGVIANNHFIGGWGIEYRVIDTANTGDTTNRAGTQTSASQDIQNVSITGNTLDLTGGTTGGLGAIRLIGVTTGHINNASVTGNTIMNAPERGIDLAGAQYSTVSGNTIHGCGTYGVYANSSAANNLIASNNVRGAQNTTGAGGAIAMSGTTNNNAVIGNNLSTEGSTNSLYAIDQEGTTTTNVVIGNCSKGWSSANSVHGTMTTAPISTTNINIAVA